MIKILRQEYNKLSELDKKILSFSGKVIFGEISKVIILLLFFTLFHETEAFLFATFALLPIRCQMGGLHCKSYWGCLTATLAIYVCSILLLPAFFKPSPFILAGSLLICAFINWGIEPIINPTRPRLTQSQIKQAKIIVICFIFCYIMLSFALQFNHLIVCGVWIIIIQTLQLIAANIQRRRRSI